MMENKTNKPTIKLTSGMVVLTLWNNTNQNNEVFETIKLERIYKDNTNKWQTTDGFRKKDLPDLELVVNELRKKLSLKETVFQ